MTTTYITNTSSSAATYVLPTQFFATSTLTAPAPKPLTPLEWLDAQIERTCALARAGG